MSSATRIFITGASCAGITTLGEALASGLGVLRPDSAGRNRARHEAWLATQGVMMLKLDGTQATPALVASCLDALKVARERGNDG